MRRALGLALLLLTAGLSGCLNGASEDLDPTGTPENDTDGAAEPNETNDSGDDENDADDTSPDEENRSSPEENESDKPSANRTEPERPPWPDPTDAPIRPGVQVTAAGQCTSNFLFQTPDNRTLMLGVAAHCVSEGPQTNTNGCSEENEPLEPGAQVEIENASKPGRLVYSSWHTMQSMDETPSSAACRGNDFALVAIHPSDRSKVSPAVKAFGGPTELGSASGGDRVEWYGNTGLTPDSQATSEHEGFITGSGDWTARMYALSPGLPGDSGSGVMLDSGSAIGVLSTVSATGSNGVALLEPALAFANEHEGSYELVTWSSLDEGSVP